MSDSDGDSGGNKCRDGDHDGVGDDDNEQEEICFFVCFTPQQQYFNYIMVVI